MISICLSALVPIQLDFVTICSGRYLSLIMIEEVIVNEDDDITTIILDAGEGIIFSIDINVHDSYVHREADEEAWPLCAKLTNLR